MYENCRPGSRLKRFLERVDPTSNGYEDLDRYHCTDDSRTTNVCVKISAVHDT